MVLIRRMLYVAALGIAVVPAIAMQSTAARGHQVSFTYISVIQIGVVATLLWCVLYLRVEPILAKIALGVVVLVLLTCVFVYRLAAGPSNQTMEPTATRFAITFSMTKALPLRSTLGLGSGGLSCSR